MWLVSSDAILTQTAKALKDPRHPYRQKIDVDFGGRVEVYTKQELLNGQNFNPTAVTEQLSIMVLSYDSFCGRGKEGLKAYQENSNLSAFAKVLGTPENPIEKADETALFQLINQLNPLVIVDERHHARSEVLMDTIDLRDKLEEIATAEYQNGGKYIRSIALFQAQPKGKEDATTFEKLRVELVDAGIPAEHIAIRTADVNELKNVDLLSPDCPVRYIITVNALKEGRDCSFAYILASLANKTSQVDVEQILGRILRPYRSSSQSSNRKPRRRILPGWMGKSIGVELQRRRESENSPESAPKADSMLAEAQQAGDAYNQAVQGSDNDPFAAGKPCAPVQEHDDLPVGQAEHGG